MNIVLIGFMGSGKTTVGKALAKKLGMRFVDLDREFERLEGKKIHDVFKKKGERYFRKKESEILCAQNRKRNTVFATGGGVVLKEANRALLKKLGIAVWLDVSAREAHTRTKHEKHRPLLNHPKRREIIRRLLELRKPWYAEADVHVKVGRKDLKQVVEEIEDKIYEN